MNRKKRHQPSGRRSGLRSRLLSSGQSMLEATIAIGIVVSAISSSMALVQSSIKGEKESANTLIGANLAREGIEVVRAIRDSNWLADNEWDLGLGGAGLDYTGAPYFDADNNNWTIDFTVNNINDATATVYRHTTGSGGATVGLFVQAAAKPEGAVKMPFRRMVTLDALCDNGVGDGGYTIRTSGNDCGANDKVGLRITSTVQWLSSTGGIRDIQFEERMFDWR